MFKVYDQADRTSVEFLRRAIRRVGGLPVVVLGNKSEHAESNVESDAAAVYIFSHMFKVADEWNAVHGSCSARVSKPEFFTGMLDSLMSLTKKGVVCKFPTNDVLPAVRMVEQSMPPVSFSEEASFRPVSFPSPAKSIPCSEQLISPLVLDCL